MSDEVNAHGRPVPVFTRRHFNPLGKSVKEARDTVDGCRQRAVEDRRHAAEAENSNTRRVFERSAASWDARAVDLEETERASGKQRIDDRAIWEQGEAGSP